jgi:hypothetical protein
MYTTATLAAGLAFLVILTASHNHAAVLELRFSSPPLVCLTYTDPGAEISIRTIIRITFLDSGLHLALPNHLLPLGIADRMHNGPDKFFVSIMGGPAALVRADTFIDITSKRPFAFVSSPAARLVLLVITSTLLTLA